MPMDMVKITLWVPDQKSLSEILSAAKVSLDCGSPKRDGDGNFIITLYATKAEARKITALGYKHELDEKYGEILKQRQQEVSKADRFQGGKVKPDGLGVKR
jgi:hypothetical protein